MSDPYTGIELPTPPKGYRLARWGETYDGWCLWWGWYSDKWVPWPALCGSNEDYKSDESPEESIFAIPKPRVRIPLEVM